MKLRAAAFSSLTAALMVVVACAREDAGSGAASQTVTIFAAASTTDVIETAAQRFEAASGHEVVASFDASSTLAKQIIAGAPADVFLSAHQEWMDAVAEAGAIRAGSWQDLLANTLVLVAAEGIHRRGAEGAESDGNVVGNGLVCVCGQPVGGHSSSSSSSSSNSSSPLCALCASAVNLLKESKRIAMADPAHVPAGRYAKQSLEMLGCWSDVEAKIIPALDVRAALRLVEMGEADTAIVYATDVRHAENVRVVMTLPASLHDAVHYPIALCTESAAAAAFLEFLRSDEMREVFEEAGFRVLPAGHGSVPMLRNPHGRDARATAGLQRSLSDEEAR